MTFQGALIWLETNKNVDRFEPYLGPLLDLYDEYQRFSLSLLRATFHSACHESQTLVYPAVTVELSPST